MRKEYDFSKGQRGAVLSSPGKTRITSKVPLKRLLSSAQAITLTKYNLDCPKMSVAKSEKP